MAQSTRHRPLSGPPATLQGNCSCSRPGISRGAIGIDRDTALAAAGISLPPEFLAQRVFGALEHAQPALGQILAGTVDVEGEHRHGGAERLRLAAAALLGGALERPGDLLRRALGKDAALEIERVARARDRG